MYHIFQKIINRLRVRKQGNLIIGRKVAFENKGKISSGVSSMGAITNITVKNIAGDKKSSFQNSGKLILGEKVHVYGGFGIYIAAGATLSIDDNTYINPGATIVCKKDIRIGKNCAISWRCQLMDDDLHSIMKDGKRINPVASIVIGNHVWICSDVTVLPGTKIEDGVVVAAGSVVKGKLDAHCLYGGIPAKKLREGIEWQY